jgi:uncharacterized iron-regulated protein
MILSSTVAVWHRIALNFRKGGTVVTTGRFSRIIASIVLVLLSSSAALADVGVLRLKDSKEVTFTSMMDDVANARAIFIGEVHDNRSHHQMQLEIIRALNDRKARIAIGLEMFQTDSQQALDDWAAGKTGEEEFKAIYAPNWSFGWELYRDIFLFARDNRIPMVALNIPKQIVSKVAKQGFASLSDKERNNLPPGITCELKSTYTRLLEMAFGQVFKHVAKQSNFTNFCEAQTLRNSGMAWNLEHYRQKNPDRTVVVIAGIWHAVKGGAPAHMELSETERVLVILPEIPELGANNATLNEADYLVRKPKGQK